MTVEIRRKKPIISIHMWTEQFLGTAQKATDFLAIMKSLEDGKWVPEKWGQFEPIKNIFTVESEDQIIRDWTEERHGRVSNVMLFKKRKPSLLLDVTIWRGRVPDLNYLWFDIDATEFLGSEGVRRLKSITMDFISWSGAVYGTAWHSQQRHYRSAPGNPGKRLDQLNWLTYLGGPYIDFFGPNRIQNCPFYSCESFGNGLLLTAAERPDSPAMTESDETLIALEECLGSDAFASEGYPDVACKVPVFDLSETVTGRLPN
jgi:hypothetical protein